MDTPLLEALEVGPRDRALASVIWLHGLGADGSDFVPVVPELGLPETVRFVFPHAPVRPVTVNGGLPMRAWYDISSLGGEFVDDDAGLEDSRQHVERLIAREHERGVAARRIVLAGFSQGGAIALHTGLRHRQPLAGIMALSTYLPLRDTLAKEASEANRDVPILMCHGAYDPVVVPMMGETSRDILQGLGYRVEWHSYPMEHSVCMEEIADISKWLQARLA